MVHLSTYHVAQSTHTFHDRRCSFGPHAHVAQLHGRGSAALEDLVSEQLLALAIGGDTLVAADCHIHTAAVV
jgi:hypothetical protein